MILLDTDIAVDIVREISAAVQWLVSISDQTVTISGFTAIELFSGCRSNAEQQKLERVLRNFEVIWPSSSACEAAFVDFCALRLAHGIGAFDCFIAQTALQSGLPLYTFNVKHFQHVSGLTTIQPYQR